MLTPDMSGDRRKGSYVSLTVNYAWKVWSE